MSLPRYPRYKDSGIAWMGRLPEHWGTSRLKNLFTLMKRAPEEGDEIVTAFRDGQVTLRSNRRVDGFTNAVHEHGYQRVRAGDLVIHAMDAFAGAIGVSDSDGKSTPVYSVCTPTHPVVYSQYYGRLLRHMALTGYINSLSKGIRERSTEFRWNEASEVVVAVPELPEQVAIASFLEHETAKIDALVAEQERLIELLKEKRQSVISHAVTKGLNPDVPMKESGIEWLGEVPAHWQAKRLKQVSMKLTDGEHISPSLSTEGVALLSAKDVRDRTIDYDVDKFVSAIDAIAFWRRCKPERGDVLVVSRGATVGRVGLVTEDIDFCLMGSVILCKPTNGYSSEFLYYVLNAKHSQMSLWFSSASSAQQAIYIRDVAEVPFAVPPIEEREAIVAFLDSETSKIETLTAEAQRAIELLQERRTALISAAVTGQIDVREAAGRAA